jgi:hypothetical protein
MLCLVADKVLKKRRRRRRRRRILYILNDLKPCNQLSIILLKHAKQDTIPKKKKIIK